MRLWIQIEMPFPERLVWTRRLMNISFFVLWWFKAMTCLFCSLLYQNNEKTANKQSIVFEPCFSTVMTEDDTNKQTFPVAQGAHTNFFKFFQNFFIFFFIFFHQFYSFLHLICIWTNKCWFYLWFTSFLFHFVQVCPIPKIRGWSN